jgi:peptide-methionine (S)-S-oxide reductase
VNPTYHSLGDHSESVEIDYDPAVVSYQDLLEIFWAGHDPGVRSWSTQYRAAVFYHTDEQKRLALEARKRIESARKIKVQTEILPFSKFYPAEAYHQKYSLRGQREVMKEFRAVYPSDEGLMNSTAAARINGYLNGFGSFEDVKEAIDKLDLPPQARDRLFAAVRTHGDRYGTSAYCVHN